MNNKGLINWIIRFIKGLFIGSGFILPGVSGGVLAVVFGMYERMISFLSNITKDFKKNFIFFFPVGLGGIFGVYIFSVLLKYFFEKAETQLIWSFIGCIVGTLPTLLKQASKKGRKPKHIAIMFITAIISLVLLRSMNNVVAGELPLNIITWFGAGALVALGSIIPGLSPSNFLIFLNMYKPMTEGISNLDMSIIIPIGLGGLITVISLSKLMSLIFEKAYASMFHMILGIVLASTIMIIPISGINYLSTGGLICVIACVLGVCLGGWMSKLEEKYKPD